MIVCVCNNINYKTITTLLDEKNVKNIKELQKEMPICNQCRACSSHLKEILCEVSLKRATI